MQVTKLDSDVYMNSFVSCQSTISRSTSLRPTLFDQLFWIFPSIKYKIEQEMWDRTATKPVYLPLSIRDSNFEDEHAVNVSY